MKKMMTLALTGIMVLSTGVMSFADSTSTPAAIYAESAGITVEEAFSLRGEGQHFGELAQEEGLWSQFTERFLSLKKEAIEEKVGNGDMTRSDADSILEQLEDCDGTGSEKLLSGQNMQFGKNSGNGNQGNGFGAKNGNGLRDGSGSASGQKNGNGRNNN